jgi:hypothetical protein
MTTKTKDLERLERDYFVSRQQILENPALSFEKDEHQR